MRFDLPSRETCSFCQDLSGERECAFVVQTEHAAALVNERQYEAGAALVIPRSHRESVLEITDAELEAVYRLAKQVARAATLAFGAVGVNIFQNNGVRAGQSEPHFHVHVVSRYPSSDPDRRFVRHEFEVISLEEQRAVAAAIRGAL
jgi:histidine triad (HIT) family protein